MLEIADWLEKLGMSEYVQCFAENKIDATVLCHLTDGDLKDVGIPLGHRRKMLAAIGELAAAPATLKPAAQPEPDTLDTAERRHVTVMFCDLVGSTALSGRMDPEDLREIISAYQKCVVETIRRFDGFVARYMGDGLLMYFGYPRAHEDDAERAVRAGLELIAAVTALKLSASLRTRVGIATGEVVVGDLVGAGDPEEAKERDMVGKTPNLAAHLQGIAEPNTVVICDTTRRLLGNIFELKDLGRRDFKGISEPVWVAQRASAVASRFEALHPAGLTALVGRDEELELLLRRWSTAKSGEGQVVLLSGEPGIGKSRLAAALQESVDKEPHALLRFFCSPQDTDSALYPIISQMESAAGLVPNDTPQAKLDKLDAMLARTSTSIENATLFADLLSLTNDGRYPALELTAEQRRQRTLDAFILQMQALTRSSPALMIFEDAHWSDPTSLEALGRAVDRIATLRVLLLVTFRPEFDPPWIGRPHVTALTINRLAQRQVDLMIDHVVGSGELPAGIRQDIVERTDGIPLFVEEMTKALLEAGSESAAEKAAAAMPIPSRPVPASLHASLMARLDRLGAAKEVAQIGAAIGRTFSHALLAAVVPKPEAELESAIGRLIAAGLLFRQGVPPHATYLFKHALVQDEAYGTLLRKPRRALHARIAETLEGQFADIAERQPELLARHYTEADLSEKAAALWGKAGQRSLERSALVEAAEQLSRALAQIAVLPTTPALRREQIQLQVALITPLMHLKGYASSETKAAAERARLLIEQAEAVGEPPDDALLLFSVLHSFWTASFVAFDGDALRERASQFLTLAEKRRATVPIMIGHRIMGSVLHTGAFEEGRAHLDRAIALYDPAEHLPLATHFGQDVRVAALSYRSWALWMLGHPDAALVDASRAVEEAREIGQAPTLMYALFHALFVHIQCGDHAGSAEADELVALANDKGALFWKALGMSLQGYVLAEADRAEDAMQKVSSGIEASQSTGSTVWMPSHLSYLARACAGLGQFESAWRSLGAAMTAAETTKERWYEAEIYRVAGETALLGPTPDPDKAEEHFERALAIARSQQAKSWELRAATSLARLWRGQGKRQQAYDCLAPVYAWFTEGFDTIHLRQAKALLDELASEGNGMAGLFGGTLRLSPAVAGGLEAREERALETKPDRD
jgi:predicted ATPase/class 3 adenylate cyclase